MSANEPFVKARFRIAVREYDAFDRSLRQQWESFEQIAGTGLSLELVQLDLQALEEVVCNSGAMEDGAWDMAFVTTDWVSLLAQQGRRLMDLTPLLAQDPPQDWPDGWTPSLQRRQNIYGRVLGVPYHDGPECLMYRKDLFDNKENKAAFRERFGRELAPPTTWQHFQQTARFFHDPARALYGTAFAAFPDGHNSVYDFLLQLWTRGGELIGTEGEVRFDNPEAVAAMTFYREMLRDQSAVHPDCAEMDSVKAGIKFVAGELALAVNWFGFATFAHTQPDSRVQGKVDIAPVPSSPPHASVSLNAYWLLSIARGSSHPDVAWRFMKHVMTPAMDRITTLAGGVGCRKSTWTDPDVNATVPFYHRMEQLHSMAREIPARPDWPKIARAIDTLVMATISSNTPIRILLARAQQECS